MARRNAAWPGVALLAALLLGMVLQVRTGLADNGDFSRSMRLFTPAPTRAGAAVENLPPRDSPDWDLRFFRYWIPRWHFHWDLARIPSTSAVLLWLPGALLNACLQPRVLHLPLVALIPRALLVLLLVLLLRWTDRHPAHRPGLLVAVAAPLVALLTSTDVVAYLNTFYREAAALVFFGLFGFALVRLGRAPSVRTLLTSLAALLGLAAARPSSAYWPILGVPFIALLWLSHTRRPGRCLAGAVVTLCALLWAAVSITGAGSIQANPYNALFHGVLTFSDEPGAHLDRLGLGAASRCIGKPAPTPVGRECLAEYGEALSFLDSARVLAAEPVVLVRSLAHAAAQMQDFSLDYLGKYAIEDPRSGSQPLASVAEAQDLRFWRSTPASTALNAWSALKYHAFPTGAALYIVLLAGTLWFSRALRRGGVRRDLGLVGLLATIACPAEMAVAVLGDGRYEIVKHLFLANLTFDAAAIAFLGSLAVELTDRRSAAGDPLVGRGRKGSPRKSGPAPRPIGAFLRFTAPRRPPTAVRLRPPSASM